MLPIPLAAMRTGILAFCAVLICSIYVDAASSGTVEPQIGAKTTAAAAASIDEPVETITKRPRLQFVTKAPELQEAGYRTGKLAQFAGFATPAPLPLNAMFLYSSVWAVWSAWSFCANGVRIRVRACNTIRGFSCYGTNKEETPCEDQNDSSSTFSPLNGQLVPAIQVQPPSQRSPIDNEYEATDPYNEDRELALKQLYGDYDEIASSTKSPQSSGFLPTVSSITDFPDHEDFNDGISTQPLKQFLPIGIINSPNKHLADGNQIGQVGQSVVAGGNGNQQFSGRPPGGNSVGGVPLAVQQPLPAGPYLGQLFPTTTAPTPISSPAASKSEHNCEQTPYYPYWICVTNVQPQKSPFGIQASLPPAASSPSAQPPAHQPPAPQQPTIFDANSKEVQAGVTTDKHLVHIDGKTYEILVPPAHQEKSSEKQSSAIVAKEVESANDLPTLSKINGEENAEKVEQPTETDVEVVYETDRDGDKTIQVTEEYYYEEPDKQQESSVSPNNEAKHSEPIFHQLQPAVTVSIGGPQPPVANKGLAVSQFGEELGEEILGNQGDTKQSSTGTPSGIDEEELRRPDNAPLAPSTTEDGSFPLVTSAFSHIDEEYLDELEGGASPSKAVPIDNIRQFTAPSTISEEHGFDNPSGETKAFVSAGVENESKPERHRSSGEFADSRTLSSGEANEQNFDKRPSAFTASAFIIDDEADSNPTDLKLVTIKSTLTHPPPMPSELGFDQPNTAPVAAGRSSSKNDDEGQFGEGFRDLPQSTSKDDSYDLDEEQYSFGEGPKAPSSLHEPKTSSVERKTTPAISPSNVSPPSEQVVDSGEWSRPTPTLPDRFEQTTVGVSKPVNRPSIIVPELPQVISASSIPFISEDNLSIDQSPSSADALQRSTIDRHEDYAEWSRWSEWGGCFCGKKARTRSCDYDSPYLTKGCVGKSYETKPCTGGTPCPDVGRNYIEPSTTPRPAPTFYTLAPQGRGGPSLSNIGYALQAHPLSHAWRSHADASLTGERHQPRR